MSNLQEQEMSVNQRTKPSQKKFDFHPRAHSTHCVRELQPIPQVRFIGGFLLLISFIMALIILLCASAEASAGEYCFMVRDLKTGKNLVYEGECTRKMSPCSTFKIVLSLMGYDAGILENLTAPMWPYEESYGAEREELKQAHNPRMWIDNSCVWYSQVLAEKLGKNRFDRYVKLFGYGNGDTSGDPGQHNGLTGCWLCSSLKISPEGQVSFLSKLVRQEFPVSPTAYKYTGKLLFLGDLPGGWKLYGKTGTGFQEKKDGVLDYKRQFGWFAGWAINGDRCLVIARLIFDRREEQGYAGKRAREQVKEWLARQLKAL